VIVVADEAEKHIVDTFITELNASGIYDAPIVTQILVGERFRVAESYHQDFYTNNPSKPYCQLVVKPKLEKIISLINK
jgi:peptide-methionine (S)-S-oxide reductase